jgi:hypothetical protein
MRSVHELIKAKLVEKVVGLLSVSVEDRGFFPLEWFFVYSCQIWVLRELWWWSWWWC